MARSVVSRLLENRVPPLLQLGKLSPRNSLSTKAIRRSRFAVRRNGASRAGNARNPLQHVLHGQHRGFQSTGGLPLLERNWDGDDAPVEFGNGDVEAVSSELSPRRDPSHAPRGIPLAIAWRTGIPSRSRSESTASPASVTEPVFTLPAQTTEWILRRRRAPL